MYSDYWKLTFLFLSLPILSLSLVPLPDPPGDERFPEAPGRVLRGPETIPEECVCSERLFPVS